MTGRSVILLREPDWVAAPSSRLWTSRDFGASQDDAIAILGIVVGHALDQPSEYLPIRWSGLTPPHLPQLEVLEPPKDDLPLLFQVATNEAGKTEFAERQGSTAA
jgi:hypothetical protein